MTLSLDNSLPLISVLMPVYNTAQFLESSIKSILCQTYQNFELIIIDDGSHDTSISIINKYSVIDSRIISISRKNKGIVATRNELLQMASGSYFAIMDSDDISSINRLEVQYNFLSNNPDYFIVGCRDLLIDPDGDPIKIINDKYEHNDIDAANLRTDDFLTLNGYMAITSIVKNAGGYRTEISYAEDRDLFLRLAELGKVKVISEVLYEYRQHYNNICVQKRSELNHYVFKVINDALERRNLPLNKLSQQTFSQNTSFNRIDYFNAWAWWALEAKNISTAKKYSLKIILLSPFSFKSWRLLYCVVRGY